MIPEVDRAAPDVEYAAIFERAVGHRLLCAEHFLLDWPGLFGGALLSAEVALRNSSRLLLAIARFQPSKFGPEIEARFSFWAEQAGGATVPLGELDRRQRANFLARVEQCEHRFKELGASDIEGALAQLMSALGFTQDQRTAQKLGAGLSLDLGSADGLVTYDGTEGLFVRANRLPPLGDRISLLLTVPGLEGTIEAEARVSEVRSTPGFRSDRPAGFGLALASPSPALLKALRDLASVKKRARAARASERRGIHRVAVNAPVKVSTPPDVVRVERDPKEAVVGDCVTNLSMGGAFVRTQRVAPLRTQVTLDIELPNGEMLKARGVVANVMPSGMGVQFWLDQETEATLAATLQQIGRPPPRALVVDDDGLIRTVLADELKARGFEVLFADSGMSALRTLLDEVLTLDVLVTDMLMPGLDGESLITRIRHEGGEPNLAIVVFSGRTQPIDAARLGPLGADLVLDKAVGARKAAEEIEKLVEGRRDAGEPLLAPPSPVPPVPPPPPPEDEPESGEQLPELASSRRQLSVLALLDHIPTEQSSSGVARVGNYQILSLLGRGGMAEVYYARAVAGPRAGQAVAIKRLAPEMAAKPEAVELFASEADISLQLDHPNIVKTYEVGQLNAQHYLVMEAVDGRDLGQIIRCCKQRGIFLPIDFACFLVKSLLDALDHVHHARGKSGQDLNVVHCDVSPSNLFISRAGEIKLGDFGLSRSGRLPASSEVRGKVSYLSPEVLDGEVTADADLWAVTVTLYELLTNECPFEGQTQEELLQAIRKRRYSPARKRRPEIPSELEGVVRQGFAASVKSRHRSAAQFAQALTSHFDANVGTPLAIAAVVRGLFG